MYSNPKDRPTAKALLQHPWFTSRVDSSPSITPSSTAIESPKAAKHVLQFGATVGRPTSDSSTTPPVPKMGDSAPDDWFKIPKAAAVTKEHQLLLSNKSEGSDGGMCQLGIASYLTEVLNDNEKQVRWHCELFTLMAAGVAAVGGFQTITSVVDEEAWETQGRPRHALGCQ